MPGQQLMHRNPQLARQSLQEQQRAINCAAMSSAQTLSAPAAAYTDATNPYIRPSDGPLFRRYLNWAGRYYDQFPMETRQDAAEFDRWLYSRKSVGFLAGVLCGLGGLTVGLYFAGLSWPAAILLSLVAGGMSGMAGMRTWLMPDSAEASMGRTGAAKFFKTGWAAMLWLVAIMYCGMVVGAAVARVTVKWGEFTLARLGGYVLEAIEMTAPIGLAIGSLAVGTVLMVGYARRKHLEMRLAAATLSAERDATERALSQARLAVLQAQIKPHFLFNTLAALQHWVDTQDPRAPELLRALTGFLRKSTDQLNRPMVLLSEEFALVEEYLKIMQFRVGKKLQWQVSMDESAANREVPPAMVLSLVENAVEHGVTPSLSGGYLHVSATEVDAKLTVAVRNTGAPLHEAYSEGVGLSNTRERLRTCFGHRFAFDLRQDGDETIAQFSA